MQTRSDSLHDGFRAGITKGHKAQVSKVQSVRVLLSLHTSGAQKSFKNRWLFRKIKQGQGYEQNFPQIYCSPAPAAEPHSRRV